MTAAETSVGSTGCTRNLGLPSMSILNPGIRIFLEKPPDFQEKWLLVERTMLAQNGKPRSERKWPNAPSQCETA